MLQLSSQRIFKLNLAALNFVLFLSIALSQLPTPPANNSTGPDLVAQQRQSIDNATLNLHRWGAVTQFHGLPSDRVNAIAEDLKGVLWFGTDNGLVSYDGRNVEAAPNEASLPSRRVLALKLDASGSLWIGTDAGAARLRDGRIEKLPETANRAVTGIALSPRGEVAVVTANGEIVLYREQAVREIRSETKAREWAVAAKLDQYSHPLLKSANQPNEALSLVSIAAGGAGEWLVGSNGRGLLINRANELREAAIKPPRPYFVASVYDDGSRVWLAEKTSPRAGGIWLRLNDSLTRTAIDTGAVNSIHGGGGELWAGTTRRGAFLLRPEGNDLKLIEHLTFENTAGGLRSNSVTAVFRDREGIVWFGTDRGVCRYDRSSFRASRVSASSQSNYVRVMLRTSSGETWCGTNRGLFKLASTANERNTDRWVESAEMQGLAIYALTESANAAVWAGTSSGLFVKPKATSLFARVSSAPNTSITITEESDPAQNQTAAPPQSDQAAAVPQSDSDQQQSKENVRAVAEFRGRIYAAFYERGVERIDETPDGFSRTPVLTDAAAQTAVCLASEGGVALWYGTSNGELRRYDGSQTASISLPERQQTSSTNRGIGAIAISNDKIFIGTSQRLLLLEGGAGREIKSGVDVQSLILSGDALWCATKNAGLFKILQGRNISTRFDTEQGLTSQQVFALSPGEGNEIWIGTNSGVVRHRPSDIEPRMHIRRLVADQIYLPDKLTSELSLPHTQENFLLEVTGIGSRTFSSQFQYEFALLDGGRNEIRRVHTRDAQFAVEGLNSGQYEIVARSISRDLVYSKPLSIRLQIRRAPFPWPTLLLASLLAAAVAAAVWAFRQQRRLGIANRALEETNVELRETRLRLANETEAERSRIARDLHDQTLADLRHLLVLTDQLPPATADDSKQPSPAALRREIESISSEIRHICEDLSPSALENLGFLPALEWALNDAVTHLPAAEKFDYQFVCEPELEDRLVLSHIEQIQLYRIVQEALNNTCRHAKASRVKISVSSEDDHNLAIEVCDDGTGFAGAASNVSGHGIANIRSRANLIGARVEWIDAHPGCRFAVRKDGCVTGAMASSDNLTSSENLKPD
jgi:signal transduction histidine kinase